MRHEIMTKRTREEIERLQTEMVRQWLGRDDSIDNPYLRQRALSLIFNCVDGAREDYNNA